MKKILLALLLTASLSYGQTKHLTISSTGQFVIDHLELKPVKGMIVFEKGIEQYGIKIDTNYYFIRYRSLIPVNKKIKSFKPLTT